MNKEEANDLAKEIGSLELKLFDLKRKLHKFNQLHCMHLNEERTYEHNRFTLNCNDCGFTQNIDRR
tara:strand:+ start:137 stop:334 length:198 start_codon:yes stop_codon:yes gene_type:complete